MKEAFHADRNMLIAAGVTPKTVDQFIHLREQILPDQLLEKVKRAGLTAITKQDATYPKLLREIYDPPPVLFIKGKLPANETAHLAIVGSRKATPYGLRIASQFSQELAESGIVIVSGLAYGVDEAAHTATVKAGGITVAVLACGILSLNSRQRYLADKIVDTGGAVISEFPINANALRHNFPIRNRIISGMSHGTLIVEAAIKSGSLITARSAMEQGRDVFAIPGPIHSPSSAGTNELLKTGAHLVTDTKDILEVLAVDYKKVEKASKTIIPDSKEEGLILDLLSKNPIHIDEMVRSTQLAAATIAATLSLMEIKGRTKQIGGMYYVLT